MPRLFVHIEEAEAALRSVVGAVKFAAESDDPAVVAEREASLARRAMRSGATDLGASAWRSQRDSARADAAGLADAIDRALRASGWDGGAGPLTNLHTTLEAYYTRQRDDR